MNIEAQESQQPHKKRPRRNTGVPAFLKSKKFYVFLIGAGMALSPIHNQWLTNLATNSRGEVVFFLPSFGYLLWIFGVGMYLLYCWDSIKKRGLGDKRVFIPLIVIVAAMGLSGITASNLEGKVAPLFMGLCLFGLYLVARDLGKGMFVPLAVGVGLASVGIIVYESLHPGIKTGGLMFEHNFDIAAGYILLGCALFIGKWQWLMVGLALVAMVMSGAPEAYFALGILAVVFLVRRDYGVRTAVILPALVAVALVFILGYGQPLYNYTLKSITNSPVVPPISDMGTTSDLSAISWRWHVIWTEMSNLSPLGAGYNITGFTNATVHNVPLIIVQQLGWGGILAGLSWLWVSVWCLIKTKWTYVWVLVLALCVWDHYMFTQLGHFWWAIVGVSSAGYISNDYVFKKVRGN